MANFQISAITENGVQLKSHVDVGAVFTATRIVIGSGYIPSGKTAKTMTDVVSPIKELPINKKERSPDGRVVFGGVYTNEGVTAEFYFRELALYAKAVYPNGTEVDEVLYCYLNAAGNAELMAAYSTGTVVERQMDIVTYIGNEAQVDLTIQSGLYLAHAAKHAAGGEDPITPNSIGALGKFEALNLTSLGTSIPSNSNLDDYTTPGNYYSARGTTTNTLINAPLTGEGFRLVVMAGYVDERVHQFAFCNDDLIYLRMLRDGAWSNWTSLSKSTHTHSTVDIITGTLPLSRGGTNAKTAAEARTNLNVPSVDDMNTAIQNRAVAKTGDQTMAGSLAAKSFTSTDGIATATLVADGVHNLAQLSVSGSRGSAALTLSPDSLVMVTPDGYSYEFIHAGNINDFFGVAPATVE